MTQLIVVARTIVTAASFDVVLANYNTLLLPGQDGQGVNRALVKLRILNTTNQRIDISHDAIQGTPYKLGGITAGAATVVWSMQPAEVRTWDFDKNPFAVVSRLTVRGTTIIPSTGDVVADALVM